MSQSHPQGRAFGSRRLGWLVLGLVLASTIGCQRRPETRPTPASDDMGGDGYSEKPRTQTGGGVPSVSHAAEPERNVTAVEELLIGRYPGVEVTRTGDGGYSVNVRGTSSFMSSEQPLWVIDGMQVEVAAGRGLSWLNPADVVRIRVLRNPSETAIYGVRGANGVIVVATKRKR